MARRWLQRSFHCWPHTQRGGTAVVSIDETGSLEPSTGYTLHCLSWASYSRLSGWHPAMALQVTYRVKLGSFFTDDASQEKLWAHQKPPLDLRFGWDFWSPCRSCRAHPLDKKSTFCSWPTAEWAELWPTWLSLLFLSTFLLVQHCLCESPEPLTHSLDWRVCSFSTWIFSLVNLHTSSFLSAVLPTGIHYICFKTYFQQKWIFIALCF